MQTTVRKRTKPRMLTFPLTLILHMLNGHSIILTFSILRSLWLSLALHTPAVNQLKLTTCLLAQAIWQEA